MLDQLDPSTEKYTSPTGLKVRADLYDEEYSDEDYESKPGNWKLAYRAGREATGKARAFATAWLAELD